MKSQKLKIQELAVNSFITTISGEEKNTLKGEVGAIPTVSKNAIVCALSQIKHICLPFEITEATITINEISISVVNSNRNTDCTGATRPMNICNATVSPCKV